MLLTITIVFLDPCGGILEPNMTHPKGMIKYPLYLDNYPPYANCSWKINAPPQWKITLNFTMLALRGKEVANSEVRATNKYNRRFLAEAYKILLKIKKIIISILFFRVVSMICYPCTM